VTMKRAAAVFFSLVAVTLIHAQQDPSKVGQDPAARKILDQLASQAQADYPISLSFDYIYESLQDNQTDTESGTLILQHEKFRLSIGESEVFCDGQTMWHHIESANEVYISDPMDSQDDDEFFLSNPSELFTFYREDYKYRLTRELSHEGKQYDEVDLFPNDLNKSYHTIKLLISKDDRRLHSAEVLGKHGENHTVIVRDYRKKVPVTDETFVFDPSSHPGIEVVDTRL
jgi:outer membrane lipoprotein carrier protein